MTKREHCEPWERSQALTVWWAYIHGEGHILKSLLAGMSEAERCQLRQQVQSFSVLLTDGERKEHAA